MTCCFRQRIPPSVSDIKRQHDGQHRYVGLSRQTFVPRLETITSLRRRRSFFFSTSAPIFFARAEEFVPPVDENVWQTNFFSAADRVKRFRRHLAYFDDFIINRAGFGFFFFFFFFFFFLSMRLQTSSANSFVPTVCLYHVPSRAMS